MSDIDASQTAVPENNGVGASEALAPARPLWQLVLAIAGAFLSALAMSSSLRWDHANTTFLSGFDGNHVGYALVIPVIAYLGWLSTRVRSRRVHAWAAGVGVAFGMAELLGKALSLYPSLGALFDGRGMIVHSAIIFLGYMWLAYAVAAIIIGWLVEPQTRPRHLAASSGRALRLCDWVDRGLGSRRFQIGAWLLLSLSRVPYLIWSWPGVVASDTQSQIGMAIGMFPLGSHHPVAHTFLIKLFVSPANAAGRIDLGVAAYSCAQILVTSAIVVYTVVRMRAWRIHIPFIVVTYGWFMLYPVNALYAITMLKNIPFAFALLASIVMLVDLARDESVAKRPLWLVGLGSSVVAVFLLRSDGPAAALGIAAAALILMRKAARRRVLATLLISVGLAAAFRGPGHTMLSITPARTSEALSVPLQQIARVCAVHSTDLKPDQEEFVRSVFGGLSCKEVGEKYSGTLSDPVKATADDEFIRSNLASVAGRWFALGREYPADYLTSFLVNTYGYWYPEYVKWTVSVGVSGPTEIPGLSNTEPGISPAVFELLYNPRSLPGASMAYSIGFGFHLLILALAALAATRRWRLASILLPAAGVVLGCLVSPVSGEYRYAYGFLIALPVVLAVTFGERTALRSSSRLRRS